MGFIFFLKKTQTKVQKNPTNKLLPKQSSVVHCHYRYAFSLFCFTIERNFKRNMIMGVVKESPRDQIESLSKIIRVFENVTSKLLKTTEIQKTLNSLDFPSFHAFRITLQNV